MCERTVSLESTSTLAIWSFVRPSATRSMTSHSRAVSGDLTGRRPLAPSGDRRSCSTSLMLIRRLIAASPLSTPRSACGSTSMSTSLARKPAAPARSPSMPISSSSVVVRMTTSWRGLSFTIRRVAAIPSSSGMTTSISTTSGW